MATDTRTSNSFAYPPVGAQPHNSIVLILRIEETNRTREERQQRDAHHVIVDLCIRCVDRRAPAPKTAIVFPAGKPEKSRQVHAVA
jgi:hypothetical protein